MTRGSSSSIDSDEWQLLQAIAHAPAIDPKGQQTTHEQVVPSGASSTTTPVQPDHSRQIARYQIVRELGRGGMGIVYEARDPLLGRTVALKLLSSNSLDDTRYRDRLLREARAAACINSRNVVTVYDVEHCEDSKSLFIVMQYIEGQSLRSWLSRNQPCDLSECIRIALGVATGLDAAHQAGVLHGDLKPENVMLDNAGNVILVDFGLSLKLGERQRGLAGTRGYMAPELFVSNTVTASSDLWSLGILLRELFDTQFKCPPHIEQLILQCTKENPTERPASVALLVHELSAYQHEKEHSQPRSLSFLVKNNRGRIMAVFLFVLVGASMVVSQIRKGDRPSTTRVEPSFDRFLESLAAHPPESAVLACVPLVVKAPAVPLSTGSSISLSVTEADQWLGAAAASIICRRARSYLGEHPAVVIPPAGLLDLYPGPSESMPVDPYSLASVEQAKNAALHRTPFHVEGELEPTANGFRMTLSLYWGEHLLDKHSGESERLFEAVALVVDEMILRKKWPIAHSVHPHISQWTDLGSIDAAVALTGWYEAQLAGSGLQQARGHAAHYQDSLGALWPLVEYRTSVLLGESNEIKPLPFRRDSLESIVKTAPCYALLGGQEPPENLIALLRDSLQERFGDNTLGLVEQQAVLIAEANLRCSANQRDIARPLLIAALKQDPFDTWWDQLLVSSLGQPGFGLAARAYGAWIPEAPDAWNVMSFAEKELAPQDRLERIRRAYLLAPTFPLFAANYGRALLLLANRREEARSVAGRLAIGGPMQKLASERLLAEIEIHEKKPLAAQKRLFRALKEIEILGKVESGDLVMVSLLLSVSELLGDIESMTDQLVEQFVLSNPVRLYPGALVPIEVSHLCSRATKKVAAKCLKKLQTLRRDHYFAEGEPSDIDAFILGAQAWVSDDLAGAVKHWRRVQSDLIPGARPLLAKVFDRWGDHDFAERIDRPGAARGLLGKIGPGHGQSARRALLRGDKSKALLLANEMISAWAEADAPIPEVEKMRQLLQNTK